MKFLILLAMVALAAARPDNHYDTKYDNFNMEELTSNKRLMCSYGHCFIGDGKCTSEGNDIKGWMDEGIATSCGKCSEKQKILVATFIKGLRDLCPDEWVILHKRGDPEGKRNDELDEFIKKYCP